MKLRRPKSIIWFEWLFVTSIFLFAAQTSFNWVENIMNGDVSRDGWTEFNIAKMIVTIFSLSLKIALWYFIARRANNIAKWILVVITTLGLGLSVWTFSSMLQVGFTYFVISSVIMQLWVVLCIAFLFRKDARNWFRGEVVLQEDSADLIERFR